MKKSLIILSIFLATIATYTLTNAHQTRYYYSTIMHHIYRVKYNLNLDDSNKNKVKEISKKIKNNSKFNQDYAILVNLGKSKNKNRFFIINVQTEKIVYSCKTFHGKLSGAEYATSFSNEINSKKSSLGLYVIKNKYIGKYGESFKLIGLNSTNSNAYYRNIVLHPTMYTSGYSYGCPVTLEKDFNNIKNYISSNTALWIYTM